ncbi:nitronate monooxygenase [Caballeronia sp. DA-9]|uniref:nitronate monooxygenase n=1 Tax=Caballeronia sp. DA-9 TaxID=3436237 RepID=UPI003F681420
MSEAISRRTAAARHRGDHAPSCPRGWRHHRWDDLATALSFAAKGVVFGTAFISTNESFAHTYHKQRIVGAAEDETLLTNAFHFSWPEGARVSVLPNSVTRGHRGIRSAQSKPSSKKKLASRSVCSAPTRRCVQ